MRYWIVPSNNGKFRLADFLASYGYVDWKQKNRYEVGDVVFIYCTKPEGRIRFVMTVERTGMTFVESTKDEDYWLDKSEFLAGVKANKYCRLRLLEELHSDRLCLAELQAHGLNGVPQGALNPSEMLIDYIMDVLGDVSVRGMECLEGLPCQVSVTRYERNPIARNKCVALKGCVCSICGFDFEKAYGEIGKGYIQVHHIVPVSQIKGQYNVDYVKDLIPVCPNCHAMLHRKGISVEDLRGMVRRKDAACNL